MLRRAQWRDRSAEVSGLQHDAVPETEAEDRATAPRTFCGESPQDVTPRTRTQFETGHRATQPRIATAGGILPAHRSERCVGRTRWLDQAPTADAAMARLVEHAK